MIVEPYTPAHLTNLLLQPAQAYLRPHMSNPEYGRALQVPGLAFSCIEGDRVLGCAGLVPFWAGRAEAWAMFAANLNREFIYIHQAAVRFLDSCGIRRVEAHVDAGFGQAQKWVEMLGFEYEGPLRAYTPDGRDCLRYARVRN